MKKTITLLQLTIIILPVMLCCDLNKSYSQSMQGATLWHAEPVSNFLLNDSAAAIALAIVDSIYDSGLQTFKACEATPPAMRSIIDEDYFFIPYSLKHLLDSINEKKITPGVYEK